MKQGRLVFAFLGTVLFSTICDAEVRVIRDPARGKAISVEVVASTPNPSPSRYQSPRPSPSPKYSPDPSYTLSQPQVAYQQSAAGGLPIDYVSLARQAISQYGGAFGASTTQLSLKSVETDRLGMAHVRFSQVYRGVFVYGGELVVHLKSNGSLRSINGNFLQNISLNATPAFSGDDALEEAVAAWNEEHPGVIPEAAYPALYVFSSSSLSDGADGPYFLVYAVQIRNLDKGYNESFFVDAHTKTLIYHLNNVRNATRREVYDCTNSALGCVIDKTDSKYPGYVFGRSEGQPERGANPITQTSTTDILYTRLKVVRDYYREKFNRDGGNGQGGLGDGTHVPFTTERAYLRPGECPTGGYNDGYSIHLCSTSQLIDVIGHEYSHSVTNFLVYQGQSGALAEAFSELNQEGFQHYLKANNDWLWAAEDTPSGWLPDSFMDPHVQGYAGPYADRFYDSLFYCGTFWDNGGVHLNSMMIGKAAYLASEGGSFNGCNDIKGIGLDRVLQIWYRAYTQYMTATSNFNAAYTYFNQACQDLYGNPICYQLDKALRAVELDQPGRCSGIPRQAPQCDFCPNDLNKTDPGCSGCGVEDMDSDGDGTPNCFDACPNDPNKITPERCGCGVTEAVSDNDNDSFWGGSSCGAIVNDCNDADSSINPEAVEVCDGKDNDCDGVVDDGLTFDADGDGYTSAGSCAGTKNDCNDSNASIHPGANDICGNGIDEDCDGKDALCPGACSDTDGGNVPSKSGVTNFLGAAFEDRCLTTQYVVEFYCGSDASKGDIMPQVQLHRCASNSSCIDGACTVPYGSLSKIKLSKRMKTKERLLKKGLKKRAKKLSKKNKKKRLKKRAKKLSKKNKKKRQ